MFSNLQALVEIIYAVLTSPAIPIRRTLEDIEELLVNLNFEIVHRAYSGDRIRLVARYHDSNGEADFTTSVHIDSGFPDGDNDQRPRAWVEYKLREYRFD